MKIINFYHFDSDPGFPPFLLYVRWKSGVTFVRRCFRDVLLKELTFIFYLFIIMFISVMMQNSHGGLVDCLDITTAVVLWGSNK